MTIVLGYDESAGAQRALEVSLDLAARLGEPLVVGFGAQPPGRQVGDEFGAHARALEEAGRDLLLRLAEEREARLIAVGSYGESPLRGAVLGSVPHELLHLSPVPVLAVPAP
jgi:nucleotide-binding universal stress UspA family protein